LLLFDVVGNIAKITLNTADRQHDLVLVFVGNVLAAPAEVVIAGKLDSIGHKIIALDDQILNDGIDHRIGILDSWNGNVANALESGREDDLTEILNEMA